MALSARGLKSFQRGMAEAFSVLAESSGPPDEIPSSAKASPGDYMDAALVAWDMLAEIGYSVDAHRQWLEGVKPNLTTLGRIVAFQGVTGIPVVVLKDYDYQTARSKFSYVPANLEVFHISSAVIRDIFFALQGGKSKGAKAQKVIVGELPMDRWNFGGAATVLRQSRIKSRGKPDLRDDETVYDWAVDPDEPLPDLSAFFD